jgi:hypothetical protein
MGMCVFSYSCSSESGSDEIEATDIFIEEITTSHEEIIVQTSVLPLTDLLFDIRRLFKPDNCQKSNFIFIEHSTNHIILAGGNGNELHRTGGEGRGPGEFQSIMWAGIGSGNRLYIIDGLLFRVSVYDIHDSSLNFSNTLSYENPSNLFLSSIYPTEHGVYGVYQETEGFYTAENRFILYKLDAAYAPAEKVLEMPGHERQKYELTGFDLYTPHKYRHQSHWYMDNNWFYYAKSDDSTIFRYHLETGKKQEITFLKMEKRANSTAFSDLVIQSHSENNGDEYDAEYWEALHDIDELPLFTSLLVKDPFIYLTLLPTPGSYGITLLLNMEKQETSYFRTPQEYIPRAVCGNSVYGIDFRVEDTQQVVKVELLK